jgi:23S rRNA (uracil1939-C5)-methyltransferase
MTIGEAGPVFELTTDLLVYGGEALGRLPDGKAVFVPFALPGERVRIRLIEEKRSHARAELLEVLEPAPERIQPRCVHFGVCGGCQYQHMPYEMQVRAKTEILHDQLVRIGRLDNPPVRAAVPSPEPYYYRNTVQFHLTLEGQLGYYLAQANRVFAIQECHLPEGPINLVWPQLEFDSIPGLERVGLRMGVEEDVQLILESSDPQPPEFSVEEMAISAVHLSPTGMLVLAGSDHITLEVLGRPFRVSGGSFFQVNTAMAEKMVAHLLDHLEIPPSATVMDVFCGVGLFSAFLAPKAARLIGIESSPSASEDFVANLDEFDHVELYEGLAEEILPVLDLEPDVIVVDPPRAGLERETLDAILKLHPGQLAYISCDPATLARDGRRLSSGGYRLQKVTPFDLFPQTAHIESISFWTPS